MLAAQKSSADPILILRAPRRTEFVGDKIKVAMKSLRLPLFALVSLLWISQPLYGQTNDYVHIKWVDKPVPDVEWVAEGRPLVALPLSIKHILDRHFPQYRVPENQDY